MHLQRLFLGIAVNAAECLVYIPDYPVKIGNHQTDACGLKNDPVLFLTFFQRFCSSLPIRNVQCKKKQFLLKYLPDLWTLS